jgi:hypothetical protein
MARRRRGEDIEKFRARDAEGVAKPIAAALQAWSQKQSVIDKLRVARPEMPSILSDRATDICEPLLSIADLTGGEWPGMARTALVELCGGGDVTDENTGTKLLAAARDICHVKQVDQISTIALLKALIERDGDEPWAVWWEADIKKENTRGPAAKLAHHLRPFGIVSRTIREEDGRTPKGHKLASFEDAFFRYLPPMGSPQSRHNDTTGINKDPTGELWDATRKSVAFLKRLETRMNKGLWRCCVFCRGNGGEAKPPSPKPGDIKRRRPGKSPWLRYTAPRNLPDDNLNPKLLPSRTKKLK